MRVVHDARPEDGIIRSAGSATIAVLPAASLRERMTKFASFTKFMRRGDAIVEMPSHPSPWLVNAIDARSDWPGVRYLVGISDVPILRFDGSLWQQAGFDPRTGVLFEPAGKFPIIPSHVGLTESS